MTEKAEEVVRAMQPRRYFRWNRQLYRPLPERHAYYFVEDDHLYVVYKSGGSTEIGVPLGALQFCLARVAQGMWEEFDSPEVL